MRPGVFLAGLCGLALLLGIVLLVRLYVHHVVSRRISDYQEDLINQHFDEVRNMYSQVRGWRHDYHNHIQTLKAYLAMGETEKIEEYLGKLETDLTTVDTVVKTGNVMVDAILNSKLSLAKTQDIHLNVKAIVPPELPVSEVELCVILGNLLDNAMESCQKIADPEQRFIRVYVGTLKGQLYLSVTNSAARLKRRGNSYLSTKDSGYHGFGLRRIDEITTRCGGYVNRQSEEGVFATEILLPM